MEDEETLKTCALVSKFADAIQDNIHNLFANGVVSTSIVIGCIFLAGYQLLRMEKLAVGASSNFIHNSWLQINEDSSGDVLAGTSLAEEGVEAVISSTNGLVRGHLAIRLDAMFQAVQLPASIANLDSSLADVD